jgi:hypothetical protein
MKTLNKLLVIGVALALPIMARGATSIGIEGSVHDFSTNSWQSRGGVCSPCHQAHNTDAAQIAPLWAHQTSTGPFTPYSSPSMQGSVGTPSGVSLACLSCHDGTIGVNAPIGGLGTNAPVLMASLNPAAVIGPDLHTTHPISFTYDAALATADGALENPTTYKIGDAKTLITVNNAPVATVGWQGSSLTGKTIDQAMLFNHKMECGSCHDVHKLDGNAPGSGILVRISGTDSGNRGSLICRTCHIK